MKENRVVQFQKQLNAKINHNMSLNEREEFLEQKLGECKLNPLAHQVFSDAEFTSSFVPAFFKDVMPGELGDDLIKTVMWYSLKEMGVELLPFYNKPVFQLHPRRLAAPRIDKELLDLIKIHDITIKLETKSDTTLHKAVKSKSL